MKLTYYGTSGGQGLPGLFCACDTCRRARERGGRNIMTRSQALVSADNGDTLLIDFPGDTNLHIHNYGLDLTNIGHCIVTHAHEDHFQPDDIAIRGGFSIVTPENVKKFHLYGSDVTGAKIAKMLENDTRERYSFTAFEPYNTYDANGFKVTALAANHSKSLHSLNYIIERDGKSLLYATDTAYPDPEFFTFIEGLTDTKFDVVSLDCAWTNIPKHVEHMNIEDCTDVIRRLTAMGRTHESTRFILTHFAHFGLIYDEIVEVCRELYRDTGIRIEVAYDGFFVKY